MSAKDIFHRSPLFYVSRLGSVDSVSLLLTRKSGKNDGSLHEASRCFHSEVMRLLIDAGHDPNHRSRPHCGRTALGEMALYGIVPDDDALGDEAADILKEAGADPLAPVHGKSIVFLALDNQDPVPITRLLLDRVLGGSLNDEGCIYQRDNLHYSPSMYVAKGICKSPKSEAHELLELLKGLGATDHYYASMDHQQPHDAIGLPAEIQEVEDARRANERCLQMIQQNHSLALKRNSEEVHHDVRMADLRHDAVIRQDDALAKQKLRQREQEHTQGMKFAAEKHRNDANIAISTANTNSQIRRQEHVDTQAMRAEVRAADRDHTRQTREADLNHISQKRAMKLEYKGQRHVQGLQHRAENWRLNAGIADERARMELTYNQTMYNEAYRQRGLTHEQSFGHQNQIDFQNHSRVAKQNQLQFQYNQAERLGYVQAYQQYQYVNQDNMSFVAQLASGQAAESHQMKMDEMQKHQRTIAGHVNLQEWAAYKQGQQASGGAYGSIAAGPETYMLTEW